MTLKPLPAFAHLVDAAGAATKEFYDFINNINLELAALEARAQTYTQDQMGLTFLETASGTNAADINLTTGFGLDYKDYEVRFFLRPSNDGVNLTVRNREGGATVSSATYDYSGWYSYAAAGTLNALCGVGSTTIPIGLTVGNQGAEGCAGVIQIHMDAISTPRPRLIINAANLDNAGTPGHVSVGLSGSRQGSTALDGLTFAAAVGNINGTVRLYGLKRA